MGKRQVMTLDQYVQVHQWVKELRGIADRCEVPSCTRTITRYSWANISEEYRYDLADWVKLCRKCHYEFDSERSWQRQVEKIQERYSIDPYTWLYKLTKEERDAFKEAWIEREQLMHHHPLDWSDREMKFLMRQGLDIKNIYLAMGNTLTPEQTIPEDFIQRYERLASDNWPERLERLRSTLQ